MYLFVIKSHLVTFTYLKYLASNVNTFISLYRPIRRIKNKSIILTHLMTFNVIRLLH